MTTTTIAATPRPSGPILSNVLTSEWTKIRSVRSTYWTLIAAMVTTIGISAIACAVFVAQFDKMDARDRASLDPASFSLVGGVLAQLAIAVLGVLVISGEYSSGTIRTTMAAVPQRLTVLFAKVTVFGALTFAVMITACLWAFYLGQAILGTKDIGISIGAPNAVRTVFGTALYLTILGLLSLGIGGMIRKTAGAISAMAGILFVLPVVAGLLPSSIDFVQKYLPSEAGTTIINGSTTTANPNVLSPWLGLAVFALYALAALAGAGFLLVKRDA